MSDEAQGQPATETDKTDDPISERGHELLKELAVALRTREILKRAGEANRQRLGELTREVSALPRREATLVWVEAMRESRRRRTGGKAEGQQEVEARGAKQGQGTTEAGAAAERRASSKEAVAEAGAS